MRIHENRRARGIRRRSSAALGTAALIASIAAGSGAVPAGAAEPDEVTAAAAAHYPLHTSGRWIVDASGSRVKLASVNWDGAESPEHVVGGLDRAPLGDIARWIKRNGFNSVRLPWSDEMYERNPVVK